MKQITAMKRVKVRAESLSFSSRSTVRVAQWATKWRLKRVSEAWRRKRTRHSWKEYLPDGSKTRLEIKRRSKKLEKYWVLEKGALQGTKVLGMLRLKSLTTKSSMV